MNQAVVSKEGPPQTFQIATLGCRTNQYESQAFADQLLALGYVEASKERTADLCIVNTCTVTQSADAHSRRQIRQLAKRHPNARFIVTGCLAERDPEQLKGVLPDVEIVSNRDKHLLVQRALPDRQAPEFAIANFEAHTRAFVKIQDGCNSFCSYCIIPYVRGRSRSRGEEEILREVQTLIAGGYREVVLTGINIGDFDGAEGQGSRLADLVRKVDAQQGLDRLRISSIDPDEVDDDLIDALIKGKTTCPSMHIVLQSGSNVTLKRMNRKYTRQIFLDTCAKLQQVGDFTFTTDVIVGFPGETEADFQETLDVIRRVQFAKVHVFPFSRRPGTRAFRFPDQIPPHVMQERKTRLLHVCEQVAFELRAPLVDQVVTVLTEDRLCDDAKYLIGHTGTFIPVLIQSPTLVPNQLVRAHILRNTPQGLIGAFVDEIPPKPSADGKD